MLEPTAYLVSLKHSPGLAKEFILIGNNLRRHGWRVRYLLSYGYSGLNKLLDGAYFLSHSTTVRDLIIETARYPVDMAPRVRELFRERPPNFLLVYNPHPSNVMLIRLASKIYPQGIRAIYLHEPYVPDKSSYGWLRSIYINIVEWLQTCALDNTNCLIVPSQHSQLLFDNRYPNYRGPVYLAPILLPDYPAQKQPNRRYISLIGNLNQSRGPEDFLALINYAAARRTSLRFKILTRTPLPNLDQALSSQARELVEVMNKPIISDEEIAAVVAESIAIFLPHKQAAQSGNIPVAFRAGTPVIARNIPGLSQHVHHKKNGFLFSIDAKPKELLEAACFARNNFATLSRQARQDFENIFSEDNWDRYYQWLIESTRGDIETSYSKL